MATPSVAAPSRTKIGPTEPASPFRPEQLQPYCRRAALAPGDILRRKGQHYADMFMMTAGTVEVDLGAGRRTKLTLSGAGIPIGEIAFLRGCPATATVTARTAGACLVIDDAELARLESEQPALASSFLCHLALTAEERASFNLIFAPEGRASVRGGAIDVLLCRNREMLEQAQRLRYEVYCEELGRKSPYADHVKRTISDPLDDFGHTFIAVEDGDVIGTFRGNRATEGFLGLYEELYGMRASPHHPEATAVCTKFIVRKSKRRGPAALKLISAMVRFGVRHGVRECYIDCIPPLLHYYKALGFKVVGREFFHRENGPSVPMMLDVARHGRRLSRDADARDYLRLYLGAHLIRTVDRLRGLYAPAERSGGRR
jgi:N-acyl-L-homoserine lactone synthetase